MATFAWQIEATTPADRKQQIIQSFTDNYSDLMAGDTAAWRGKFRKMAETAFAFYRGSAPLFYSDVSKDADPFLNEKTSRVWIQGDLHAENFGTYMNGKGVLVFDVNDFDEAYVAPFNWDVKRFCASLALIGYQKALSDAEIMQMVAQGARAYAGQISKFAKGDDKSFALTLENTKGALLQVLHQARMLTRVGLLTAETDIVEGDRKFKTNKNILEVDEVTRKQIEAALLAYYNTIPDKKKRAKMQYQIKDIARRKGLGIGSAGLTMYSILIEGETQALENDILISMKVSQPSAAKKFAPNTNADEFFLHEGHRTTISQRALQANADPFSGYTSLDGKGMYVAEVSPYTADLEWDDINDMDDILEVVDYLGRCIAKIHCCSDDDSDMTLVDYSIEDAINAVLDGKEANYIEYMTQFGLDYAARVREDHRIFVDAFRNHEIAGI